MMTPRQTRHMPVIAAFACAMALTGCDKKGDAIASADQADKKAGLAAGDEVILTPGALPGDRVHTR